MKVENGRIVEATESELRNYWLTKGLDDIYSFPEYLEKMQECGVKVIDMTYGELIRGSRTNEELAEIYCYELGYRDECPPDFVEVDCNIDNCGFNCWLRYFNKEVKEGGLSMYEGKEVYTCEYCDEAIYHGNEYAEINGGYYHKTCLTDEISKMDLLELLEVNFEEADYEDVLAEQGDYEYECFADK